MFKANERGFTLPEVLVVAVILIALLAASVFFLRPKSYDNMNYDAQRRLGLALLAQALADYKRAHNAWPEGLTDKDKGISNQEGGIDLCKVLVPTYLHDVPLDPTTGFQYTVNAGMPEFTDAPCNEANISYTTGYVVKLAGDTVSLSAVTSQAKLLTISIR